MTVSQYQHIYKIQTDKGFDDVEKLAYTICFLFNKEESEVNLFSPKKFLRYSKKVERKMMVSKPWFKRRTFKSDAKQLTLGQFIEVITWLKKDPIDMLHMIAASILVKRKDHATQSVQMLDKNIKYVLPTVLSFIESFESLLSNYKFLFEDKPEYDSKGNLIEAKSHPFIINFGWLFSAKQVAEYEGIKLDEAYNLPVIQALNNMTYLKSKGQFEQWQSKA